MWLKAQIQLLKILENYQIYKTIWDNMNSEKRYWRKISRNISSKNNKQDKGDGIF